MEDRGRRYLHVVVEIGHPVAAFMDDAAILHHAYGTARRCWLVPLGEQPVDPTGFARRLFRRRRHACTGQYDRGDQTD